MKNVKLLLVFLGFLGAWASGWGQCVEISPPANGTAYCPGETVTVSCLSGGGMSCSPCLSPSDSPEATLNGNGLTFTQSGSNYQLTIPQGPVPAGSNDTLRIFFQGNSASPPPLETFPITVEYHALNYPTLSCDSTSLLPSTFSSGFGSLSASPSNALSNTSTGELDFSGFTVSTPVNVTYTSTGSCSFTTTESMTYHPSTVFDIDYGINSNICNVSGSISAVSISPPLGIHPNADLSASGPLGGYLDVSSGNINVPGNTNITSPQSIDVFYSDISNSCSTPGTTLVTILPLPDASFSYPDSICTNQSPVPINFGTNSSGTIQATGQGALSINATTLEIIPSNSDTGSYVLTYTTAQGQCTNSDTELVNVDEPLDPTIGLNKIIICSQGEVITLFARAPLGNLRCNTLGIDTVLTLVPNPVGSFTYSTQFGIPAGIPTLHFLDFKVEGPCPDSFQTYFTLKDPDPIDFIYPDTPYCAGGGKYANPTFLNGPAGGVFSLPPSYPNAISPSTGEIALDSLGDSTLIVTYFSPNLSCPDTATFGPFHILPRENAMFDFGGQSIFCTTDTLSFSALSSPMGKLCFSPNGSSSPTDVFQVTSGSLVLPADSLPKGSLLASYITDGFCPDTFQIVIQIDTPATAIFSYSQNTFCQSPGDSVTPVIQAGVAGGSFSIVTTDPIGYDPISGSVSLDSPGSFSMSYQPAIPGCSEVSFSGNIVILPLDTSSFSYSVSHVCTGSNLPPAQVSNPGGSFSFQDPGISPAIQQDGSYFFPDSLVQGNTQINYLPPGSCPVKGSVFINVIPQPGAYFRYSDTLFCLGAPAQNVTGTVDSIWSFSTLSACNNCLNPTTGELDLNEVFNAGFDNPQNPVWVESQINGLCPDSHSVQVAVSQALLADFTYPKTIICKSDPPLPPTEVNQGGVSTYSFESLPANTSRNLGINSQGVIDPAPSDTGSFLIKRLVTTGAICADSHFVVVTLADPIPNLSLTYPDTSFCQSSDTTQLPTISPMTFQGGRFTAIGPNMSGLSFSSTNGDLFVQSSAAGGYTLMYQVESSPCRDSAMFSFSINEDPNSNFSFPSFFPCQSEPNYDLANVADSSGYFTTPGAGLFISDSNIGTIAPSQSESGVHLLTHTVESSCTSRTEKPVTIYPIPSGVDLFVPEKLPVCQGETITLVPQNESAATSVIYIEDSIVAQGSNSVFVQAFDTATQIKIVWTMSLNQGGCQDSLDTLIEIVPIPYFETPDPTLVNDLADNPIIDLYDSISMDGAMVHWTIYDTANITFNDTLAGDIGPYSGAPLSYTFPSDDIPDSRFPGILNLDLYPWKEAQTGKLCIGDTFTFRIDVLALNNDFFIPEVMTPNGDTRNDVWEVRYKPGIRPEGYEILLFNRSGGLVEEFSPVDQAQQFTGNNLPDGVYWWLLRRIDDNFVLQRGGLTIIRSASLN